MSPTSWPPFQNRFFDALPRETGSPQPSRLTPNVISVEVRPTPVASPELLIASTDLAHQLELPDPIAHAEEYARIFSGNELAPGSRPLATRYGGYQFGHWAGQLGDGRAISLGEVQTSHGESWEIQLKGAGPTPYSRRADGRAVLRSSLREYLCSEAMASLGIPTTRALCCVTTGEQVVRDLFYDGNPEPEPGAITTRVAPSFLRFGHFEILTASGEVENLKRLAEHTVAVHFPHHSLKSAEGIALWFQEICQKTAHLMTEWLRVGFVHGVMNTDNLSILGLTIDYGPYGWLDSYDPQWTPNTTDAERRRYRFGNQPTIALWNLSRLAEALLPLFESEEAGIQFLKPALENYGSTFRDHYLKMMSRKLGLSTVSTSAGIQLIEDLEKNLTRAEIDPTLFFRKLDAIANAEATPRAALLQEVYYEPAVLESQAESWNQWLADYSALRRQDAWSSSQQLEVMQKANPVFILRNYIVQEVLDDIAAGGTTLLHAVHSALKTPYEENEWTQKWLKKRPDWAKSRPGCSALSCSS